MTESQDVFVASINKGQFLIALIGFIVAIVILKMPPTDVSRVVLRMVDLVESARILGFVAAAALAVGWFWHARWQRRVLARELRRLSRLRTELQKQLLGRSVKSSGECS
jgi:hypothetical protein